MVIFAVEKLEDIYEAGNRSGLNIIVAQKKAVIQCCRSILNCSNYITERQTPVFLVFMIEKIVIACRKIVALYRADDRDIPGGSVLSLWSGRSSSMGLSHCGIGEHGDLPMSSPFPLFEAGCTDTTIPMCTGTALDWQGCLLSDYEINSPFEWEQVVRVLIFLQLSAVAELLADVRRICSKVLGEAQIASLGRAETKVGQLRTCMQRMNVDRTTIQNLSG